jgi:predicted RNase H-like HicB family nuclease
MNEKGKSMLSIYLQAAMEKARYEIVEDDKSYFGEIPDFEGLWANGKTLEECRKELLATLEDWLLLSIHLNKPIPVINNIDLTVKSVA